MSKILKFSLDFTKRHSIVRGMLSYGVLWPTACFIQQKIEGKTFENIDWKTCGRFAMYGSLFTAPTFYAWVKFTSAIWPQSTFRTAITKVAIEQISYGPTSLCCFFVGMNLLEGKSFQQGKEEITMKFWPTYKVGMCFWPIFQTFNFSLVPERNRVLFGSCGSLVWVVFLAYMKKLHMEKLEREKTFEMK